MNGDKLSLDFSWSSFQFLHPNCFGNYGVNSHFRVFRWGQVRQAMLPGPRLAGCRRYENVRQSVMNLGQLAGHTVELGFGFKIRTACGLVQFLEFGEQVEQFGAKLESTIFDLLLGHGLGPRERWLLDFAAEHERSAAGCVFDFVDRLDQCSSSEQAGGQVDWAKASLELFAANRKPFFARADQIFVSVLN